MNDSIKDIDAMIGALDTLVLQHALEKTPKQTYHITAPALATLLGTETDTLETIMRRLNTYIWNNSLTCAGNTVKLTPQLQEAVHIYTATTHYSDLVVAITRHIQSI